MRRSLHCGGQGFSARRFFLRSRRGRSHRTNAARDFSRRPYCALHCASRLQCAVLILSWMKTLLSFLDGGTPNSTLPHYRVPYHRRTRWARALACLNANSLAQAVFSHVESMSSHCRVDKRNERGKPTEETSWGKGSDSLRSNAATC